MTETITTNSGSRKQYTYGGGVAFGEAGADEIGWSWVGQIARVNSSKAAITRKVTGSPTPSS